MKLHDFKIVTNLFIVVKLMASEPKILLVAKSSMTFVLTKSPLNDWSFGSKITVIAGLNLNELAAF